MILDKLLFDKITPIGASLIKKAGLSEAPKDIEEMSRFLKTVNYSIKNQDFDGLMIGNIFFSFVSSIEVRDRKTTARTFEDIFGALFSSSATDTTKRNNPSVPDEVLQLDKNNGAADNWKISTDLSTNKREKADIVIGDYSISLKTLRGYAFDEKGEPMPKIIKNADGKNVKNNQNNEINVGSLSFRALLKGIISDEDLVKLKDRKGGLGSGSALRNSVLNKINKYGKNEEFLNRLNIFMNYVYDDDLYIVLKSNYNIKWILISSKSFVQCILNTYKCDEKNFEKIWYRWENNNLRMDWINIVNKLEEYALEYDIIDMKLGEAVNSIKMKNFRENLSNKIEEEILKCIQDE